MVIFCDINNLNVSLPTASGVVQASRDVSLTIGKGEAHCIAGESGCGKTIVALAIMRLLPKNAITRGKIIFNGTNLFHLSEKEMRDIRGNHIAMVFEQPQSCFNPVYTVGDQLSEAVRIHERCSSSAAREKAITLMTQVNIPDPRKRYDQYPHEYSGGMVQRAMIAMAMALKPALLIADEPTTALDVTTRSHVVSLIKTFVAEFNTALLLITHDLGLAFQLCENISIMYAGRIVESGQIEDIQKMPQHPYTQALMHAFSNDASAPIGGMAPELTKLPTGCPFHPRCKNRMRICHEVEPQVKNGVRCHL
ncbi:ABC transporter ATP-binding protein [Desulfosarcina ovata subsp. ovata]|uniref:Nickel import system ATP-binding protein NikD n=2 Tax=Desulfosarcina ovata TaxID=83564 RepID=A0A5K8AAU9_9BACT|nr:ABC transporter ATP-binding protein [Desulfosarcina ovata subsp. ovata]